MITIEQLDPTDEVRPFEEWEDALYDEEVGPMPTTRYYVASEFEEVYVT